MTRWVLLSLGMIGVWGPAKAQSSAPNTVLTPTYWQDVRPILRKHCTVCHSERKIQQVEVSAGLALDSLEAIRKGGKRPVVIPGRSSQSELIRLLHPSTPLARRMPLDADPLPAETVQLLARWIDASLPEGARPKDEDAPTPIRPPVAVRKRDALFPTKALLPRSLAIQGKVGPIEAVLPIAPLAPITALAFRPDGSQLAVGSYGCVVLWDCRSGRPLRTLTNVLGAVHDVKFAPDGSLLAVGGGEPSARGDLRLYSTSDWKLVAVLGGHSDTVASLAFSPDGKRLASASFDKTVRLWNLAQRQTEYVFAGHSDFVHAVAFQAKGEWFVTASKDRTVRLVETASGKSRLTFSGMEQDVLAVATTPIGDQVISSGFEPQLHWWNAQSGERIRRQAGHDGAVHELAVSANGAILLSAGADKTARLWDGKTGNVLRTLATGSVVFAVALRADGKVAATGGFDGVVRLWDVASGRLLLRGATQPRSTESADWFIVTPEGYFDGSEAWLQSARWRLSDGPALPPEFRDALRQPSQIVRAFQADSLPEAVFERK